MKNNRTSKRDLPFASLLLLATHLSCFPVKAMEPMEAADPLSKTSQQHSIAPRDQLIIDFINKHAPNKFETINKDRKTLDDYVHKLIIEDSRYNEESYGGPLGTEFFDLMQSAFLKEFCEKLKAVKVTLPKKEVVSDDALKTIFSDLLSDLGKERGYIAKITGTEVSHKFGSRNFSSENPGLMDEIFVKEGWAAWTQWHQLLKAKVQEITKGVSLAKTYKDARAKGITTISYGNVALDVTPFGSDNYGIYLRNHKDNPIAEAFDAKPYPRTGDQSVGYYWTLRGSNVNSLFPRNELERISCYHKPGVGQPTLVSQEIISLGLSNFKNLLYWDGSSVNDLVIGHFASLLWKMSHSSIYERGQSAITKWFLGSLAKIHGYELKFSDQWDAQLGNATEDMQAMLEFDRETFVNNCVAKGLIKLEKRNK